MYQIYPRSFNDTDGDGIGDIPGIIDRLDYLAELGVDVVWLNPVYESPNADNGYDIADYRAIMDEFGTMDDWDRLLSGLHDRGIRLVMDLVVNHTSDEHEWFVRSRNPDSDYRDWYWWREGRDPADATADTHAAYGPADEVPPNDWESFFGGPAWAYDERSGEWYLHLFDEKQPDLNWENPSVREAVFEMMEWWLEKGIDGFRMDVVNLISKPDGLPDRDPDTGETGTELTVDGPNVHEYLGEMHDAVLAGRDLLTVGEMVGEEMPMSEAERYVGADGDGLSMIFHFDHMLLPRGDRVWETTDWELSDLKAVFDRWQAGLAEDGWNSLYFNNHDQPRQVSRFGDDDAYRRESATLLGTFLHTMRGTPYVYQGEELGMTNAPFESLSEFRDVDTLNPVREAIDRGEIDGFEDVEDGLLANSRDHARTPMQWTAGPNAGFTDGEPWIKVNPNHDSINVADERSDPRSVLNYYRELFALRDEYDVVTYGDYRQLTPDDESVWAYVRRLGRGADRERLVVVLNWTGEEVSYRVPDDVRPVGDDTTGDDVVPSSDGAESAAGRPPVESAELLLGNYVTGFDEPSRSRDALLAEAERGRFELRPWEARVYRLTSPA